MFKSVHSRCVVFSAALFVVVMGCGSRFGPTAKPALQIRWTQALAFHADGLLVSASGKHISVWNPKSGKLERTLPDDTSRVNSLAVSPDGKTLAAMSFGGTVRLLDFNTGKQLQRVVVESGNAVSFSSDGKHIATVGVRKVQFWDVADGQCRQTYTAAAGVMDVACSPDGNYVAVASEGAVYCWHIKKSNAEFSLTGHEGWLKCVEFSPDGALIAAGGSNGSLSIWDVASRKRKETIPAHTGHVEAICFDDSGKHLVSAGEDKGVHLWNTESAKKMLSFPKHPGPVLAVSISPDGKYLATGCSDLSAVTPPQSLQLWDMKTGAPVLTLTP